LVNNVSFIAPSGAPAGGYAMESLEVPGNISGANRIGFFNTGGPEGVPFAIILNTYQNRTFITNASGLNLGQAPYGVVGSGRLLNGKFVTDSTAQLESNPVVNVSDVPIESGTILIRFTPSGTAMTQNAVLRCVQLNASSGVDDQEAIVSDIEVRAFEAGADSSWTAIGGSALSNSLAFNDHDIADTIHDFYPVLSVSPTAIGERTDFGFLFIVEFL